MDIDKAKERCRYCFALIEKDGRWWCDEVDAPCDDIDDCMEWAP